MQTTKFFPRIADLCDKIAREYSTIAAPLRSCANPRRISAKLCVLGDISHTVQTAVENFRAGRHTQAVRRLAEAESAIADISALTLQQMQRQAESLAPVRLVDAVIAGGVIAW